jgi:hypothetical protein
MFGWLKKQPAATSPPQLQQTVKVYLNPLLMLLAGAEQQKGSPLTEAEVLHIRDTAVSIDMPPEQAKVFYASLDAKVPVPRLNPDQIWREWQEVRGQIE